MISGLIFFNRLTKEAVKLLSLDLSKRHMDVALRGMV